MDDGAVDDSAADDTATPGPRAWAALLVRTVGSAFGIVSVGVIVIGLAATAAFIVVCGGFWLLVQTYTSVSS